MSDSILLIDKTSDPNAKQLGEDTGKMTIDSDTSQLPTAFDVEEHFNVLKEALEATRRAFHDMWDRDEILRQQNDALVKERDELMSKNDNTRTELEELRKNYTTAKQYIDRARAVEEENRQLTLELQYSRGIAGQSGNQREDLSRLQASMADLEKQLMASRRDREEALERNRELTATNQSLSQSLLEAKGQRDRLEERCKQLDNVLKGSTVERQRLEMEHNNTENEFQTLKYEYEALKRDYGKLPKITY